MDLFDISEDFEDFDAALSNVKCPAMVIGVQTDILFPVWQQQEMAQLLKKAGKYSLLAIVLAGRASGCLLDSRP